MCSSDKKNDELWLNFKSQIIKLTRVDFNSSRNAFNGCKQMHRAFILCDLSRDKRWSRFQLHFAQLHWEAFVNTITLNFIRSQTASFLLNYSNGNIICFLNICIFVLSFRFIWNFWFVWESCENQCTMYIFRSKSRQIVCQEPLRKA